MIVNDIVDDEVYTMAFDLSLKRPACVLIQAGLGCSPNIAHLFETHTWLVAPTDNLKKYNLTGKQLKQAVEKVNSMEVK